MTAHNYAKKDCSSFLVFTFLFWLMFVFKMSCTESYFWKRFSWYWYCTYVSSTHPPIQKWKYLKCKPATHEILLLKMCAGTLHTTYLFHAMYVLVKNETRVSTAETINTWQTRTGAQKIHCQQSFFIPSSQIYFSSLKSLTQTDIPQQ